MTESNNKNVYVRTLQERSHINLPKTVLEKLGFEKFVKIRVNEDDITISPLRVT